MDLRLVLGGIGCVSHPCPGHTSSPLFPGWGRETYGREGEVLPAEGLTRTRQRVAEALADPRPGTIEEVASLARVTRATVYRAKQSETVQREIQRLRAERAGKAKDLKALSGAKLHARVQGDDASDSLLLGTYKVANDVLAAGVEEDDGESVSEADVIRARRKLLQAVRVGRYLERRDRRLAPHQD